MAKCIPESAIRSRVSWPQVVYYNYHSMMRNDARHCLRTFETKPADRYVWSIRKLMIFGGVPSKNVSRFNSLRHRIWGTDEQGTCTRSTRWTAISKLTSILQLTYRCTFAVQIQLFIQATYVTSRCSCACCPWDPNMTDEAKDFDASLGSQGADACPQNIQQPSCIAQWFNLCIERDSVLFRTLAGMILFFNVTM